MPHLDEITVRERDRRHGPRPVDARAVSRVRVLDDETGTFTNEARVQEGDPRIWNSDRERLGTVGEDALGRTRGTPTDENAINVGERVARAPRRWARAFERDEQLRGPDLRGSLATPLSRIGECSVIGRPALLSRETHARRG